MKKKYLKPKTMNFNSDYSFKTKFMTSATNSFGATFLKAFFHGIMLDSTKTNSYLPVKISK